MGDDLVTSLGGGKVGHSPVAIRHVPPHCLFLAPNLQPDPPHGPAHSKGDGLSCGSSAGKVQGWRRRCGNAGLPTESGGWALLGGGPRCRGARASLERGNAGRCTPLYTRRGPTLFCNCPKFSSGAR